MNGQVKLLGLVVMLITSAVMATAAWAEDVPWDFKADGDYVKYTGALVEGKEKMDGDAGTITCEEVIYEGETAEEAAVTAGTTLAIKPRKGGCNGNGIPVEFDTNSCSYIFHAEMATSATATEGSAEIVCNKSKDDFTLTEKFPGGTIKCTIHIPQQKGLKNVTFTNGSSGGVKDITVDFNLTAVQYTQTAGTGLGACNDAIDTHNGTVLGNFTLKGDNKAGSPTDIWVEHTKP